jgi:ketopantoate reductase
MKTLIVGAGALGRIIGARLLAAGASDSPATRNATSAEQIKASGLRVTGTGGDLSIEAGEVAPFAEYSVSGSFDLIILRNTQLPGGRVLLIPIFSGKSYKPVVDKGELLCVQ